MINCNHSNVSLVLIEGQAWGARLKVFGGGLLDDFFFPLCFLYCDILGFLDFFVLSNKAGIRVFCCKVCVFSLLFLLYFVHEELQHYNKYFQDTFSSYIKTDGSLYELSDENNTNISTVLGGK